VTGNLPADALALRAEGRDAARSGKPVEACPHQRGDWRSLEWRIGHIGLGETPPPDLLRQAYNARRKAARRREREVVALALPETTGKACKLAACRRPIPWNPRVSRAKNQAREFCGTACQHAHLAVLGAERRAARAAVDPARARRTALESERRRKAKERLRAGEAAPVPAVAPRPPAGPDAVTQLMWRLAAAGETESGCRLAGLTLEQTVRVMALQRRGTRAAA
jgi:hypothetical protein